MFVRIDGDVRDSARHLCIAKDRVKFFRAIYHALHPPDDPSPGALTN